MPELWNEFDEPESSGPVVESNGAVRTLETTDFQQLFADYDPIGVSGGALIVTQKYVEKPPTGEIGAAAVSGTTTYSRLIREDYNPELRGIRGLRVYEQMRKSDGQIRGTLNLVKTPVVAARWYMDPASDKLRDKKIAEFCWNCLTKWQTVSWPQQLREALLMLDFGYYMFEKVWVPSPAGDGKYVWGKLAPRHPLDVYRWDFDLHGGPQTLWIYGPQLYQPVDIDISKLLVFTFEKESGNIQGTSVLRTAYKHWFYKDNLYKIDAIQKERHGIGIPVIHLPPNFSEADRKLADEMGRNLRTNEKAHIILPPNWDIIMLKMEGQPVDIMRSIEHHDMEIAKNILAPFLDMTRGGTAVTADQELFLKSVRFVADQVADVFNSYGIPQLVQYNFGANIIDFPKLKCRRLGDTIDWRTISFALRNLIGAGIIEPDDPLETWSREEMDLPRKDVATKRMVTAPQLPGAPAPELPRQSQAGNMNKGLPGKNAGADNSGKSNPSQEG